MYCICGKRQYFELFIAVEDTSMLDSNTENGGNLTGMGRHPTGDSGIPESLEDRDLKYLHSQRR